MDSFTAHWSICDLRIAPDPLILRLPDNTMMDLGQFTALKSALFAQQMAVQRNLSMVQLARSDIDLKKTALLAKLNQFNSLLDADYHGTCFHAARPNVPGIGEGPDRFTGPLLDAAALWQLMNEGPAPAGVTLPVTLADGTTQESFEAEILALQADYRAARTKGVLVTLARGERDLMQERAYVAMKIYRQAVPVKLSQHPALVETLPALTPLPGHTPEPVQASATLLGTNEAKVVHTASEDASLKAYQLRGNVGDHYDDEDAVVIATHEPGEPLEFITSFGLMQPGARIALKVFVILKTGNECGSAAMVVARPAQGGAEGSNQ
jgi:hypothetical protein